MYSETVKCAGPVIDRAGTAKTVEHIPQGKVFQSGCGRAFILFEKLIRRITARVDCEEVSIQGHRGVSGFNGHIRPVHNTGEPAVVKQDIP